ncbi:MAG: hypothetical protein JHD07_08815 [Bradyrhizobium sp.]|uniref:hypothetical protein n=1 Tax=Bradyrhizobium sp. TaxID=376 RepID=UPI001A1E15AE|nr:hypothetical protein [Bradyrhizobium sp.]MBJ7403379.1 hypothetical protein [Bradyrhizobium sp.]
MFSTPGLPGAPRRAFRNNSFRTHGHAESHCQPKIADMPAYWKQQLQHVIDTAQDRIQRLEAGEMLTGDFGSPAVDTTRQTIEAKRAMIVRLQRTLDRLDSAA